MADNDKKTAEELKKDKPLKKPNIFARLFNTKAAQEYNINRAFSSDSSLSSDKDSPKNTKKNYEEVRMKRETAARQAIERKSGKNSTPIEIQDDIPKRSADYRFEPGGFNKIKEEKTSIEDRIVVPKKPNIFARMFRTQSAKRYNEYQAYLDSQDPVKVAVKKQKEAEKTEKDNERGKKLIDKFIYKPPKEMPGRLARLFNTKSAREYKLYESLIGVKRPNIALRALDRFAMFFGLRMPSVEKYDIDMIQKGRAWSNQMLQQREPMNNLKLQQGQKVPKQIRSLTQDQRYAALQKQMQEMQKALNQTQEQLRQYQQPQAQKTMQQQQPQVQAQKTMQQQQPQVQAQKTVQQQQPQMQMQQTVKQQPQMRLIVQRSPQQLALFDRLKPQMQQQLQDQIAAQQPKPQVNQQTKQRAVQQMQVQRTKPVTAIDIRMASVQMQQSETPKFSPADTTRGLLAMRTPKIPEEFLNNKTAMQDMANFTATAMLTQRPPQEIKNFLMDPSCHNPKTQAMVMGYQTQFIKLWNQQAEAGVKDIRITPGPELTSRAVNNLAGLMNRESKLSASHVGAAQVGNDLLNSLTDPKTKDRNTSAGLDANAAQYVSSALPTMATIFGRGVEAEKTLLTNPNRKEKMVDIATMDAMDFVLNQNVQEQKRNAEKGIKEPTMAMQAMLSPAFNVELLQNAAKNTKEFKQMRETPAQDVSKMLLDNKARSMNGASVARQGFAAGAEYMSFMQKQAEQKVAKPVFSTPQPQKPQEVKEQKIEPENLTAQIADALLGNTNASEADRAKVMQTVEALKNMQMPNTNSKQPESVKPEVKEQPRIIEAAPKENKAEKSILNPVDNVLKSMEEKFGAEKINDQMRKNVQAMYKSAQEGEFVINQMTVPGAKADRKVALRDNSVSDVLAYDNLVQQINNGNGDILQELGKENGAERLQDSMARSTAATDIAMGRHTAKELADTFQNREKLNAMSAPAGVQAAEWQKKQDIKEKKWEEESKNRKAEEPKKEDPAKNDPYHELRRQNQIETKTAINTLKSQRNYNEISEEEFAKRSEEVKKSMDEKLKKQIEELEKKRNGVKKEEQNEIKAESKNEVKPESKINDPTKTIVQPQESRFSPETVIFDNKPKKDFGKELENYQKENKQPQTDLNQPQAEVPELQTQKQSKDYQWEQEVQQRRMVDQANAFKKKDSSSITEQLDELNKQQAKKKVELVEGEDKVPDPRSEWAGMQTIGKREKQNANPDSLTNTQIKEVPIVASDAAKLKLNTKPKLNKKLKIKTKTNQKPIEKKPIEADEKTKSSSLQRAENGTAVKTAEDFLQKMVNTYGKEGVTEQVEKNITKLFEDKAEAQKMLNNDVQCEVITSKLTDIDAGKIMAFDEISARVNVGDKSVLDEMNVPNAAQNAQRNMVISGKPRSMVGGGAVPELLQENLNKFAENAQKEAAEQMKTKQPEIKTQAPKPEAVQPTAVQQQKENTQPKVSNAQQVKPEEKKDPESILDSSDSLLGKMEQKFGKEQISDQIRQNVQAMYQDAQQGEKSINKDVNDSQLFRNQIGLSGAKVRNVLSYNNLAQQIEKGNGSILQDLAQPDGAQKMQNAMNMTKTVDKWGKSRYSAEEISETFRNKENLNAASAQAAQEAAELQRTKAEAQANKPQTNQKENEKPIEKNAIKSSEETNKSSFQRSESGTATKGVEDFLQQMTDLLGPEKMNQTVQKNATKLFNDNAEARNNLNTEVEKGGKTAKLEMDDVNKILAFNQISSRLKNRDKSIADELNVVNSAQKLQGIMGSTKEASYLSREMNPEELKKKFNDPKLIETINERAQKQVSKGYDNLEQQVQKGKKTSRTAEKNLEATQRENKMMLREDDLQKIQDAAMKLMGSDNPWAVEKDILGRDKSAAVKAFKKKQAKKNDPRNLQARREVVKNFSNKSKQNQNQSMNPSQPQSQGTSMSIGGL